MKNMTSPAKSCSILLCALLLMAAGCNNDKTNEPKTLVSNVTAPTWAAPEESDLTSSMTAVIRVDLAAKYPTAAADFALDDSDLLAAFCAGECLGVATPQDGLFFLYVASPTSNSEAVSLKYYSAHYKNLFEADDAFPFVNDDHLGTVAAPLSPAFVVAK